jgi:hypothetical protein
MKRDDPKKRFGAGLQGPKAASVGGHCLMGRPTGLRARGFIA